MSNRNSVTPEQKNNEVPEVETQHSSPHTIAKPMLADVLGGIWEGFKTVVAWMLIAYVILFIVVGGEFSIRVKWENITELWRVINGS